MPGTRPKLLHLAFALMSELPHPDMPQMSKTDSYSFGAVLRYQLDNHYRRSDISKGKPSRAAHYKRLAKKRANTRARSKK